MCLAVPMQLRSVDGTRAQALGRSGLQWIDIALVQPARVGEWVLVFLDAARERIDATRAAEISTLLDWVEQLSTAAPSGDSRAGEAPRANELSGADPGFPLPSALDAQSLAAMVGSSPSSSTAVPARARLNAPERAANL